ncbi:MAG: NAD(+) synthase [Cyclobacteriaceae bacterium]
MVKIAGATVNQTPLDWKNNILRILQAIEEAQKQKIRILCFPELCVTGYGCEDLFLSEWVAERAWKEILGIKEKCQDITVALGFPVYINAVSYNGVCVISNTKILGITLKQNLAKDGVHYEPRWFEEWEPGKVIDFSKDNEHFQAGDIIYTVDGVRFGFEICEDAWRKKNRPGYRLCERGVDLILNPSASHYAMGKSELREKEVVIEGSGKFNCVYLFVNLLGNEAGRMIYDGDIIVGQKGKLIGINRRLAFGDFNIMACDVDFKDAGKTPLIKSVDNKEINEELIRAVSLGLFDYLRKSKAKGFVVSLSGGADSSICAIFVAEMVKRAGAELGWKKFSELVGLTESEIKEDWKNAVGKLLSCAYQGTKNSSVETLSAARLLAKSIGAEFHEWEIDDEVRSYSEKIEAAIGRKLTWQTDDITLQNIQARTRSPIIWMLANIKRAVLLTTSNRSEGDVGYATMDGDTSGSFSPIAGLSKVFILQWLKWAEKNLDQPGLKSVNTLQPTAELRPLENHQTDEDDLMPYPLLVAIERLAIYERRAPLEIYEIMKADFEPAMLKTFIGKFFRLWAANQWKRERLAPSLHLDDFNVDPRSWCRFPILSSGFREELEELEGLRDQGTGGRVLKP